MVSATRTRRATGGLLVLVSLCLISHTGHAADLRQHQQAAAPTVSRPLPTGWKVFRGARGLIVLHPAGWNVVEQADGAFIAHDQSGRNGGALAFLYVQPIAKIEGQSLGVVKGLGQIAPQLFPGVQVTSARKISSGGDPDVAVATVAYTPRTVPFQGVAMCFRQGTQGVLYVIAASTDTWARAEPILKQILGNFFYAGASQGGQAALPAMVSWRDPVEGAFTVPVPQGWTVDGGLRRYAVNDTRPEVQVSSPDKKIWIRIGDAVIPPFVTPTQMLMMAGAPEGQWYSPNGLLKMQVMRYLPSAYFLTSWYFPQRVGSVSNIQVQDHPVLSQAVMMRDRQAGIMSRVDTASMTFDAQTQMGLRKGYALVQTRFTQSPGSPDGGNWWVDRLWVCLADAPSDPLAQAVMRKMVEGWQDDPYWFQRQMQLIGQVSQIVSQTHNEIMGIIDQTFRNKSAAEDRMFDQQTRVRRGLVLLQDPETGEHFEVPMGSNYYFRVNSGSEFIGAESSTAPQNPNYWVHEMNIIR